MFGATVMDDNSVGVVLYDTDRLTIFISFSQYNLLTSQDKPISPNYTASEKYDEVIIILSNAEYKSWRIALSLTDLRDIILFRLNSYSRQTLSAQNKVRWAL